MVFTLTMGLWIMEIMDSNAGLYLHKKTCVSGFPVTEKYMFAYFFFI